MFTNPKRTKSKATKKESWFDYYAGYSSAFVRDVLPHVLPDNKGRILDPWNGSGTTTTTAHEHGIDSTGIDINPVMVVVAKAKLLSPGVGNSLVPLADEIVAIGSQRKERVLATDPLLEWFAPSGAMPVRQLAGAISKLLVSTEEVEAAFLTKNIGELSDLAAFFLVALFRTTRSLVTRFRPTNPTWIKSPDSERQRIRPAPENVFDLFRSQVREMCEGLAAISGQANTVIALGSSDALPMQAKSANAVIASPPYCTRIDYAVATKPELAVLGCTDPGGFASLRRQMMGGPVVAQPSSPPKPSWGQSCLRFLKAVEDHPSKGSGNYYHKLFVQYYATVYDSLREIDRVLLPGGECVLVVQDSHYKEVQVDVAGHVSEMARNLGWAVKHRFDFEASLVMARLNPRVKKYRTQARATESVLWFQVAQ